MRRLGNGTLLVACGVYLLVAWSAFALANAVKERLSRLSDSDDGSSELADEATLS